jgi:CRISPR-associated exonuclease Cas4
MLFWFSSRQRKKLGIPEGRLLYEDIDASGELRRPLYDAELDLVGRPDYLIRQEEELIPVEVKSGRSPKKPYDSHIYQLAAYCLLVTKNFGMRPSHGLIRYPERTFKINFTSELEQELRSLLQDLRRHSKTSLPQRSHQNAARCKACGYLELCDQSL